MAQNQGIVLTFVVCLIAQCFTAPSSYSSEESFENNQQNAYGKLNDRASRQILEQSQEQNVQISSETSQLMLRLQLLLTLLTSQTSYGSPIIGGNQNCGSCNSQGEIILKLPLQTSINPQLYAHHLLQNPELLCLISQLIEVCGGSSDLLVLSLDHLNSEGGGLLGGLGGLLGGQGGSGGLLGGLGGLLGGGGGAGQGGLLGGLGGLLGGGKGGGLLGGLGGLLGGQSGANGGLLGGLGGLLGGSGGGLGQGGLLGGLGGLLGGRGGLASGQGGLLGGLGGLLGGGGGYGYGGLGQGGLLGGLGTLLGGRGGGVLGGVGGLLDGKGNGLLPGLGKLLGGGGGTLGGVGGLLSGGGSEGLGGIGGGILNGIEINNNNENGEGILASDAVGNGLIGGVLNNVGGGALGGLLGGTVNGLLGSVKGVTGNLPLVGGLLGGLLRRHTNEQLPVQQLPQDLSSASSELSASVSNDEAESNNVRRQIPHAQYRTISNAIKKDDLYSERQHESQILNVQSQQSQNEAIKPESINSLNGFENISEESAQLLGKKLYLKQIINHCGGAMRQYLKRLEQNACNNDDNQITSIPSTAPLPIPNCSCEDSCSCLSQINQFSEQSKPKRKYRRRKYKIVETTPKEIDTPETQIPTNGADCDSPISNNLIHPNENIRPRYYDNHPQQINTDRRKEYYFN